MSLPSSYVLAAGTLIAGELYQLRLTVRDAATGRTVQQASLVVPALIPPCCGSLRISPSRGTVISTPFELKAGGWIGDQDVLPLTYTLFASTWALVAAPPRKP